jgi:hypothetical protein
MGFFDKLFGEQNKEKNSCDFCGKSVHIGKGIRIGTGNFKDDEKIAQEMATRKCVCPKCGSVFCLNCANAEGHKRGTGDSHCPRCGTLVPANQLM